MHKIFLFDWIILEATKLVKKLFSKLLCDFSFSNFVWAYLRLNMNGCRAKQKST